MVRQNLEMGIPRKASLSCCKTFQENLNVRHFLLSSLRYWKTNVVAAATQIRVLLQIRGEENMLRWV